MSRVGRPSWKETRYRRRLTRTVNVKLALRTIAGDRREKQAREQAKLMRMLAEGLERRRKAREDKQGN